jgi:hypothetical protein
MANTLTSIEILSANAASGGKVNCTLQYICSLNSTATTVTSANYPTNKIDLDALLVGKTVLIMYNDIGVSGVNSVQGSVSFSPFDADGELLFTKQLSLSAGKQYAFYASLSDGTAYSDVSNQLQTVTVIDTPQKAIMTVIPLDQSLSIKIAYPSSSSIYDGYSPITSVQVTVTGVFLNNEAAKSKVYHFSISNGDYTTDMKISGLLNSIPYEVISTFFNAAGPSPISDSVTAVPSDTPDLITNTSGQFDKVFAMSKIDYDTVQNVPTNKGIVVYSKWPTDKGTLEGGGLKITKVKVILTTLKVDVDGTTWSADDTVPLVEKEYLLPSTYASSTYTYTSPDGIYNATGFDTTAGNSAPFRFIITDVAVGTAVKANVVFGNANGYPGQNGSFTQNVMSMLCPEQPTLLGHVIPGATDCSFEIYRTALPATNGGIANKYRITGSEVAISGTSSAITFNSMVEFNSASFATNLVPSTNVNVFKYSEISPTIGSTYNYNFETITKDPFDSNKMYYSNLASISLISKKTISSYKQIQVRSWNNDGTPVLIGGVPGIYFNFKAESLTDVTFHGGVNGSSITANDVSIRLAKNSQLVSLTEFPAKQHPGTNIVTALTYNIPQSIASADQYYIRVVVADRQFTSINSATGLPNAPDTQELISSDSSPQLSMASESYLPAVIGLTIVRDATDATKATLKYTKPPDSTTFSICGFNPSTAAAAADATAGLIKILTRRAHNAIVVIDDLTGLKSTVTVKMPIVSTITTTAKTTNIIPWNYVKSANNVELELAGLVAGNAYTVYALSGMYTTQLGYYQSDGTVSATNDFQGFIRKNYTSYSFVAAAPALAPTPFDVYGKNASVFGEWTAPGSFNGASLKNYDISAFAFLDGVADIADIVTPFFTAATQNPVYSTQNNYALVTSVWPSRAAGNLGTGSKIPLVNGDIIKAGIRTVTEIALKPLQNQSFTATSSDLNMGANDNVPAPTSGSVSYTSNPMIALVTSISSTILTGAYSTAEVKSEANVEPAAPQGVVAASSDGLITVSFLKATDGLSDEVRIMSDGAEVYYTKKFKGNYFGVNFAAAYTISGASSGLLFIQHVISNSMVYTEFAYPSVLSKIQSIFGGVKNGNFEFKISGTNGQTKTIGVMYVDVQAFSGEDILSAITTITAAASAPPAAVQSPSFTVADNLLSLAWVVPINIGGAGISVGTGKANNSDLKYQINVFMNSTDKNNNTPSLLYSMKDVSALTQTIALPNNIAATYYANIVAYYYNEGIITSPSIDLGNIVWFNSAQPIRVGPTPLQGSTSALVISSQSINFNYTLPAAITSYSYPINLLGVYVDDVLTKYYTSNNGLVTGAEGTTLSVAQTAAAAAGTFSASSVVLIALSLNNGLLNGGKYKVSVKPMGTYTYAQMPPQSDQLNLIPYAPIQIDAISSSQSTDKLRITTVVNMNGDELKSAIIIGRDANRVNHVQPALTGNAFYTKSGASTGTVVASQIATFTSTFLNPMEGVLIIVNGQNSSDVDDIPVGTFGPAIS